MTAMRWGSLALIVVAAVGVGVALFLSLQPADLLKYQQEWVKALLQAGLIAVLGVVTSSVLESFKDGLQRKRDQSKIRFEVLGDIGRIYMDIKLVRRRAQAAQAIDPVDLSELNARQVRLELHKHNSVALFADQAGLEAALDKMERYLNRVANKPDSTRPHPGGRNDPRTAPPPASQIQQSESSQVAGAHPKRIGAMDGIRSGDVLLLLRIVVFHADGLSKVNVEGVVDRGVSQLLGYGSQRVEIPIVV